MASVASALVQKLNRFFPLNQDELASIAGLEARRRTFTVLFHDLGKSSAWSGRRGLNQLSAVRRLVV
jgi:hypothetical protein